MHKFFLAVLLGISSLAFAGKSTIELQAGADDVLTITTSRETRRVDVHSGDTVTIKLQHGGSAAPVEKKECKSAYGKTACGYGCVASFGEVKCGDKPGQKCLAEYGRIECGYGCAATAGTIKCATKPEGTCAAAYGTVTCSD